MSIADKGTFGRHQDTHRGNTAYFKRHFPCAYPGDLFSGLLFCGFHDLWRDKLDSGIGINVG